MSCGPTNQNIFLLPQSMETAKTCKLKRIGTITLIWEGIFTLKLKNVKGRAKKNYKNNDIKTEYIEEAKNL